MTLELNGKLVFSGLFKMGIREGKGIKFGQNWQLDCTYKNNKLHGLGKVTYNHDGSVIEVFYQDDRPIGKQSKIFH